MDPFGGDDSGDETLDSHVLETGHNSTVGGTGHGLGSGQPPQNPMDTSVVMAAGGGLGMANFLPQVLSSIASTMEKMGRVMEKGPSGEKRKLEQEEEEEPEGPVMIEIKSHHLKDDGFTILDKTARKCRPWMGSQKTLWESLPRVSRPVLQDLHDRHLTKSTVNPKVNEKMHDRKAELTLKLFHFKNVSCKPYCCPAVRQLSA